MKNIKWYFLSDFYDRKYHFIFICINTTTFEMIVEKYIKIGKIKTQFSNNSRFFNIVCYKFIKNWRDFVL